MIILVQIPPENEKGKNFLLDLNLAIAAVYLSPSMIYKTWMKFVGFPLSLISYFLGKR